MVSQEGAVDELERDLLERARRGDTSAAPFLVSYLGDHLLGYARSIAEDLADADRETIVEIAVEAGTRLIGTFDESRGNLRAWFRRQVRWKVAEWRRSGPASPDPLPAVLQEQPELPGAPLPPAIVDALRDAIAPLDRDDQIVLALRAVEGLAFPEIGLRLGIKADAARQRYHRALRRLKESAAATPELTDYERGVQ